MAIGTLYLYGMIGRVEKNGKVVKCTAVFRNDSNQHYTCTRNEERNFEYTPTDVACYGQPLFLPASKKKIGDGKEYFFIFQPSKSKQNFQWRVVAHPNLRVGIYNNEEFCVLRTFWKGIPESAMTEAYKNMPEGLLFQ